MTPPKPHVAQGYCQPSQLRKQDRDDPSLPALLAPPGLLSAPLALCPAHIIPASSAGRLRGACQAGKGPGALAHRS